MRSGLGTGVSESAGAPGANSMSRLLLKPRIRDSGLGKGGTFPGAMPPRPQFAFPSSEARIQGSRADLDLEFASVVRDLSETPSPGPA